MIEVKNGQILIDKTPRFLYGGEIHYYRLAREDWEDRIRKAKEAGMNLISVIVPWLYHEPREGEIDLEGKRSPQTDLAAFLRLLQKHGMYCMLRPGPYTMSEMRNEGLPDWIFQNYPDVVSRDRAGRAVTNQVVYFEDQTFLKLAERWYKAVGRVVRPFMNENGGPIMIVQLDNEIGMKNWCAGEADYSPGNMKQFRLFVRDLYEGRESYGDLEDEAFAEYVKHPPAGEEIFVDVDLCRYYRLYLKRYFMHLQEFCGKYMGKCLHLFNVHGFDTYDIIKRGREYPSGVSQLCRLAEAENTLMAGDYYLGNICYDNAQDIHLANAYTYAVQSPAQPLLSLEFQGGFQLDTPRMQPTSYDLTARLCIADGMDGIGYFMFAGGENPDGIGFYGYRHSWQASVDRDGSLNPQYAVIARLGQALRVYEDTLVETRFEPVLELGVIPDYFMNEYAYHNPYLEAKRTEIEHYNNTYLFDGMGKGLSVNNLSFRGLNLSGDFTPGKNPRLAVYTTPYMDRDIQEKLVAYVREGGKVFLFPTVPVMDMKGRPCRILQEALGCEVTVRGEGHVDVDDMTDMYVPVSTDFGRVENGFAWHREGGYVCGFVKELGKGRIVCYGMGHAHEFYYRDRVILKQLAKIGAEPFYHTESSRDKLFVSSRADAEGGRYLTVINIDEYDKTTAVYRGEEALFGGKRLTVRARRGLLLPLHIRICRDILVLYSTAEFLELQETQKEWLLTVALMQPEEEIALSVKGEVLPGEGYEVQKTENGCTIRIAAGGRHCEKQAIRIGKKEGGEAHD